MKNFHSIYQTIYNSEVRYIYRRLREIYGISIVIIVAFIVFYILKFLDLKKYFEKKPSLRRSYPQGLNENRLNVPN
jgi:hypothetical protein